MQKLKLVFWTFLAGLTVLWIGADTVIPLPQAFFPLRALMVQYTGIIAMGCMSAAMILALRPRWLEPHLGGLDKMYRLHKWLGIGGLVVSIIHWLWAQGAKWATGLGWLQRPQRGPRPAIDNAVELLLNGQRKLAEEVGEWAFYLAAALIVLALIQRFPYRWFYKTHRYIAAIYLVLVFHTVVLMKFSYWTTPVGLVTAALLVYGVYAAVIVLLRRVGIGNQTGGTVTEVLHFPALNVLATTISVPTGWPGHKPGQFAFATSDEAEGAHPYTIASAWDDKARSILFVIKALGDHTARLQKRLTTGQPVRLEGPYGCFTFDDDAPRQIWIGGGIGITPFIARMKHLAATRAADAPPAAIDLFHATAEEDPTALDLLRADAAAAAVRLTILISPRDGFLTGEGLRAAVPDWPSASLWFCGPSRFGEALRADFARAGLPVARRFHQELFAMR